MEDEAEFPRSRSSLGIERCVPCVCVEGGVAKFDLTYLLKENLLFHGLKFGINIFLTMDMCEMYP